MVMLVYQRVTLSNHLSLPLCIAILELQHLKASRYLTTQLGFNMI